MEFKWGEDVEVSDDDFQTFRQGKFGCVNPDIGSGYKYFVLLNGLICPTSWKQCRKARPHFEKDERVLVKRLHDTTWTRRHFSEWDAFGKPKCYLSGMTSWSTGESISWDEIKKADESVYGKAVKMLRGKS